jgi:hypothetical protein
MALKIPKNIIVTSKYTSGKEYMVISTYKEYQGYYYELNNRVFAGKEFSITAPELQKIEVSKINPLLTKASTYVYGLISNVQLKDLKIQSYIFTPTKEEILNNSSTRYFSKKLNETPTIIKEINKSSYDEILQNPIYKTVSIKYTNTNKNVGYFDPTELTKAITQIPELSTFLNDEIKDGKRQGQSSLEDVPYIQDFT